MTLMSSYRNPNAFGAGQGTFMGAGGPGGQGAGTGPENAKSINVNSMPSAMRAAKMLSNDLATGKGAWGKMVCPSVFENPLGLSKIALNCLFLTANCL